MCPAFGRNSDAQKAANGLTLILMLLPVSGILFDTFRDGGGVVAIVVVVVSDSLLSLSDLFDVGPDAVDDVVVEGEFCSCCFCCKFREVIPGCGDEEVGVHPTGWAPFGVNAHPAGAGIKLAQLLMYV